MEGWREEGETPERILSLSTTSASAQLSSKQRVILWLALENGNGARAEGEKCKVGG